MNVESPIINTWNNNLAWQLDCQHLNSDIRFIHLDKFKQKVFSIGLTPTNQLPFSCGKTKMLLITTEEDKEEEQWQT